jgi:hypothetical protein
MNKMVVMVSLRKSCRETDSSRKPILRRVAQHLHHQSIPQRHTYIFNYHKDTPKAPTRPSAHRKDHITWTAFTHSYP